ncbi:MlaD family protein [Nocardia salmonicida]|uniref:MlaD family protein n=1 Tax=Nocardia salmonicida TaxID=53431 RepID=UPI0007A4C562|nr:MCE family protein [Nocardia salmonicida]
MITFLFSLVRTTLLDAFRNRYFALGIAAGVTVIVLVLGSGILSRAHLGEDTVHAEFAQAAGLRTGNSVDVAGIEVGTVTAVRLERDRVLVTMSVRPDLSVGHDAKAAIKMSTILGKMHVELDPGAEGHLPGSRIPLSATTVPYNLAKVVNDPKYRNSFEHLERLDPNALRAGLDAVSTQLGDSPALTAQALDSVGALAKVIASRRDEVDQLLGSMDQVSGLISDNQNSVLVLLTNGQAIGDSVVRRRDLIRELLDNIAAASKILQDMGIDDGGRLGPLIHNLNTMSQGLEKNREHLDALYQVMPVAVRQFNNSFAQGPYGDIYMPWLFPDNWLCLADAVEGCN